MCGQSDAAFCFANVSRRMAAYWLADWALRLNNKTVTLQVGLQRWRVAYSLLHRVVESGASHGDPAELGVADARVETMRGSFGDGVRRLQLASRRVTSADSCWMAPVGKDQPSVAAFRQSFQWLLHIEHCRRAAPVGHDERRRWRYQVLGVFRFGGKFKAC
jgi:hypothetical protein